MSDPGISHHTTADRNPDQEKNKYFKIQPSSSAAAAYSAQDVKKRKLREKRQEATANEKKKHQGRIRRSRILNAPSAGGLLSRSFGQAKTSPSLDASPILAGGLVEQGHIPSRNLFTTDFIFTILPHPERSGIQSDIWIASYGKLLRSPVVLDDYHNTCDSRDSYPRHPKSLARWGRDSYRITPGDPTSVCVNNTKGLLAVTWLASSSIAGISIIRSEGGIVPIGNVFGPGQRRGNEVDILSSAPGSAASNALFAFGSSHGILTAIFDHGSTSKPAWITPRITEHLAHCPKDVYALEFLSDQHHNHNVLLSGGRNGILNITDLRKPVFGHNADLIYHPGTITHIKQLDSHRIIVAGLGSSLCQYDLRFRKAYSNIPPQPAHSPKHSKPSNLYPGSTRPIICYPEYHNTSLWQHGFDVDIESGIIAVGQEEDEFHPALQLFSLHEGQKLGSPYQKSAERLDERWRERERGHQIKCVRFAKDVEGGMRSLYIGAARGIVRFAWAPEEDADFFRE